MSQHESTYLEVAGLSSTRVILILTIYVDQVTDRDTLLLLELLVMRWVKWHKEINKTISAINSTNQEIVEETLRIALFAEKVLQNAQRFTLKDADLLCSNAVLPRGWVSVRLHLVSKSFKWFSIWGKEESVQHFILFSFYKSQILCFQRYEARLLQVQCSHNPSLNFGCIIWIYPYLIGNDS